MKNCFRSACIALCACLLALPAVAAPYKQEYKLSVVPGATSGWGLTATYFADLVRERSQGRINIKVYASSQLLAGKQTSEFLMLRNGSIDFALASTINWSPQVKELNLPALPFFIAAQPDRYKAMDAILAGKSGQMMIDAVEKKGVKIIGWAENGFRELTTSKGPIPPPADLNGLKIRVVGSPIFIETFRALGANPVNMNWSEATTGFQQGVVDARLVVKAIDKACRHQLNKVFIACLIFTQEHQVVRAIDAVHLIETRTRGHVYFAADNGLDARLFRGFIKIDAAVHHAVVGDSHSRLAQLFHPFHQRLDAACAVQKAVFSVQMQMCKLPAVFNCHGLPPPVRLPALPAFLCGAKGRIC